eukprot:gene7226-12909_t
MDTQSSMFLGILLFNVAFVMADFEFSFGEEIYAHVIKSTSKPNTPLFHIKAPHCKYGQLQYKILEKGHPFKVSPHNGSIYLPHALNPNSPTTFIFNVQAEDANALCSATAQLQVFVVHVNEHKPIMSAAKYYCYVNENERSVEVRPRIRAIDRDEGQAGKIRDLRIREKGIPFKVVLEDNGYAKLVATEDLDAESVSEYRFSIYAVDNGTRARKSERSRVYCEVVDVNEFAPIFKHPFYDIEVEKGTIYKNLIQLEAVDQDISSKNGKVCNYVIVERDVPFSIGSNGVLSLQEELASSFPSNFLFHVRATDCASKISDDDAVVRVKVKNQTRTVTQSLSGHKGDCKIGVAMKEIATLQYPSCTNELPLVSNVHITECGDLKEHKISVSAVLDTSSVQKGCERSHDPVTSIYSQCGFNEVIELLPNTGPSWMEDTATEETIQGQTNHVFDGTSATRLPKGLLGENWHDSFTIAAWILVKTSAKPQFVLSLSDGMQLGYNYIGLYVVNKHNDDRSRVGFVLSKSNGKCRLHEEWVVDVSNLKWRHVAVVVDHCNLQLQVDGRPVEPVGEAETLQVQQAHIQPKYVIGGRWVGTKEKYTDFFRGKISHMVFTKKLVKNFNCILKCKENIDLRLQLPSGFQLERVSDKMSLSISGRGTLTSLRKILKSVVYVNKVPYPNPATRHIHIEATVDDVMLPRVTVDVEVPKHVGPSIKLAGKCDNSVKTYGSIESGLRVCPDIDINMDGCLRFLDEGLVVINSDIIGTGNLSVPQPVLKRFGLTASFSVNVLRISGVARYTDYVEVLRNVFFVPSLVSTQKSMEVKMEVSAENGRFSSNELVVGIEIKQENSQSATDSPFVFYLHSKADESAGSLVMDKIKSSSNGGGIVVITVILSLTVVVAVAGFVIVKVHRKNRDEDIVESDFRTAELLWDNEGLPATMNITLNPLLRLRNECSLSEGDFSEDSRNCYEESSEGSLYWSESEEENGSECGAENTLEWDSSYQEDFGEVCDDYRGEGATETQSKAVASCDGVTSL